MNPTSAHVSPIPPELFSPPKQRMEKEEFVAWAMKQEFTAEWVDGEVVIVSPESLAHMDCRRWFDRLLSTYVDRRQLGLVGDNVFVDLLHLRRLRVPDLFFVHRDRLAIVGRTRLTGPPDLVLEVISPDSQSRDWRVKYQEYESFGVAEYWVVDPLGQRMEVYRLDAEGRYQEVPLVDERYTSQVAPGFWIKTEWLWAEPRPTVDQALAELGAEP